MSIEKLVKDLDNQINEVYNKYVQLHEELNFHRGKPLDDTNLPEVNRLLKEIQETFALLYPAYYFIAHRYQYAVNAVNSYETFIDQIKKIGATQEGAKS